MALITIGILLLFVGFLFRNPDQRIATLVRTVRFLGIGLVVTGFLLSSIVEIDAGRIGVQKLFGKVKPQILESGLHVVNPLVEIVRMDVKTQNYTMSGLHDESRQVGDDAIRVLTNDGLEVIIDLTVLFRMKLTEAPRIVQEIGVDYVDKIVRPIARTKIRDNAVYYQAIELFSTKRDEFQQKIFESIEENFEQRGLVLEQLLVRNIVLPQSVSASIEEKIRAEQDAQKMTYVLQKEKQEAERKRVEAQGISDYQKIINATLTERQLQYEWIKAYQNLVNSNNAKVVLMDRNTPVIIDGK
ncbi:MAG: prohibitin family protein [Saprospiraceae bacterium]|nr:prohibitin family protein [Saprospiraceae bacterium]